MPQHEIFRVERFEHIGAFKLRVWFDDRTEQVIDFEPVLAGELYGPLRNSAVFRQVKIDAEVGTLVWPNGADFDPETLHNWPKYAQVLAARARRWQSQPA